MGVWQAEVQCSLCPRLVAGTENTIAVVKVTIASSGVMFCHHLCYIYQKKKKKKVIAIKCRDLTLSVLGLYHYKVNVTMKYNEIYTEH